MKFLSGLFKLIEGIILFYLMFVFLKWYIKGHFGKYFILFWICTIAVVFHHHQYQTHSEYNPTSGYEIFKENIKDYDSQRGY